jgi:outer membrane cobalamin receptor
MQGKHFLTVVLLVFNWVLVSAQVVTTDDLKEMSLEELLQLNTSLRTGAGDNQNIMETVSGIEVFTREQIEAMHFETLAEALEFLSGVHISRTYLKRNIPVIRNLLQEHYANKILFLLNNIPVYNAVSGEAILERVSITDVERLEVIKGPTSVVYGSNAFVGAINIVLREKKTTGNEYNAYSSLGAAKSFKTGTAIHTNNGKVNFSVFANSFKQIGENRTFIDASSDTGVISNYLNYLNYTFMLEAKNHSLFMNAYNGEESYLGVTPNFEAGIGNPHEFNGYVASYAYTKKVNDIYSFDFRAGIDYQIRDLSRDKKDSIRSKIAGTRGMVSISNNIAISKALKLRVGYDLNYLQSNAYENYISTSEQVVSSNIPENESLSDQSIYALANFSYGKICFQLGGRLNYNSLYNLHAVSNFGLVYKPSQNSSVKLLYGESYRAPSLFELYFFPADSTIFGNTALQPEKQRSVELVYLQRYKKLFINTILYYSNYSELIQRTTGDITIGNSNFNNVRYFDNVNNLESVGIELSMNLRLKTIDFYLNGDYHNYIHAAETEKYKSNRNILPQFQSNTGINYQIGEKYFLNAKFKYFSKSEGPIKQIDQQYFIDLAGGYYYSFNNLKAQFYFIGSKYVERCLLNSRICTL